MILSLIGFAFAETHQVQIVEVGTDLPVVATLYCGPETLQSNVDGFVQLNIECDSVQIRSPHHHDVQYSIEDFLKLTTVPLQPLHQQETVLIEEQRSPAHAQSYGLNTEDLERTPGGFDDPIRLIQALPGTVATREYGPNAGSVILRGAAPTESRLYIDGVEVPYLYHFDQYASILPTKMMDNVLIYPSNFGTSYGDAIGGIVALESKEATTEIPTVYAQANLIMAGVQASTPVALGGRQAGVLSVSGRRSFADLYESSNEQYSLWPAFSDYMLRYDIRNSEGHHFRWTALGSMDKYGRYIYDADELDPYERSINPNLEMKRRFDGGVFRWDWRSATYRARTSVAVMRDDWRASLDSLQGEPAAQRRLDRYTWIRHESIVIRDDIEWSVGFDQRLGQVEQTVSATNPNPTIRSDAPLLANGVNLDRTLWEWRQGAWVEPRFNLGAWRLITGVRLQALPLSQRAVMDPRFQLHRQFDWGKWHVGLGQYHQSPPFDQPELTQFAKSHQASTGLEWRISDAVLVGGDVWIKQSTGKWYVDPTGQTLLVDEESMGGEAYFAARVDRWDGRIGLSSVDSMLLYEDSSYVSPFSQPFFVNAMLGWRSESWTLGARYRISSGLPLTQPVAAVLDATQDAYVPTYSQFPQERMPNYQKIDVQIARVWQLRTSVLKAYCEAWAVPSSSNYLYPIYNYNYTESQLVVGPAFVPLIGMSVEH
jgi:hypothetical protein